MTNKHSSDNSEEKVIENLVLTPATIDVYTHNNSRFHLCDTTFENCIFIDLDTFFLQFCVFRNCVITGSLLQQVSGCTFESTIIHNTHIEEIESSNFQYSSLTESSLFKSTIDNSNFVRCQFAKLKLISCWLVSSTFKSCSGDWESYIDTFVMINKGVKVWNNNEWITVDEDDWRGFLSLQGVTIESDKRE